MADRACETLQGEEDLRRILGQEFSEERLRQLLAAAATVRKSGPGDEGDAEAQVRRQAKLEMVLARRLEQLAVRLHRHLLEVTPMIRNPRAGHLAILFPDPSKGVSSTKLDDPQSWREDWWRPTPNLEETTRQVEWLSWRAASWYSVARPLSLGRPGRKTARRRNFGAYVAYVLKRGGVPLMKSADGQLARALGVLYDAAGFGQPQDLYQEVARILEDPHHEIMPSVRAVLQDRPVRVRRKAQ